MLNIDRVWSRVRELDQFKNKKLNDFRHLSFILPVRLAAAVAGAHIPVGPLRTEFPGGGIIVRIAGSATQEDVVATATLFRGLDMVAIEMEYSNNERIITGGRVIASTVLGNGQYSEYPVKELVVPPNQTVLTTLENLATTPIFVTITFDCLVPRLAS